jgi:hypothetical protein
MDIVHFFVLNSKKQVKYLTRGQEIESYCPPFYIFYVFNFNLNIP